MLDECGAGRLAIAVDEVDYAGRESSITDEFAEHKNAERRLLGSLEDDGVAACKGGTELPRRHGQRIVPGDDLADDADRLAKGVCEFLGRGADCLAVGFVGPAGVVADSAYRFCEVDFEGFVV